MIMRHRRNFFGGFQDIDDIFKAFFGGEPSIPGKNTIKNGTDENGDWTKETYTSEDGMIQITSFIRTSGLGGPQEEKNELKSLKKQLQKAVENQEFETAVELRDKIKSLEENKEKIGELETQLQNAINEQNFERAIELRDELKKLK